MIKVAILITVPAGNDGSGGCLEECQKQIDAVASEGRYSFSIFLNYEGAAGYQAMWAKAAKEGNEMFLWMDQDLMLSEVVFDFYDKLKSISKGYASFDYHVTEFRPARLVKLDILLNGDPADALSTLIHEDHAYDFGRKICLKLKELIPRQQFDIAVQAAIGAKIIARETVRQVRKDVTAKCYGGDVTRKRKLLEKQKEGKKRMRQIGTVQVPQSAFMAVLKLD